MAIREIVQWSQRVLVGIAKLVASLLLLLVVFFAGYLALGAWEAREVRSFCAALRPGSPVASLPDIASVHDVNPRYLKDQGQFLQEKGHWFIYVPIAATVGEYGCEITHDGKRILSAGMRA